jgi:hypothetical protein
MQESEFRDWARRAQGTFDERLKVLEGKVGELSAGPPERGGHGLGVSRIEMAEAVLKAVKGGGVYGLGVVYLGPDGPVDGWSCSGEEARYTLLGALGLLTDRVMRMEDGAAGAAGGTDEGSPARELAGSAPAGGA